MNFFQYLFILFFYLPSLFVLILKLLNGATLLSVIIHQKETNCSKVLICHSNFGRELYSYFLLIFPRILKNCSKRWQESLTPDKTKKIKCEEGYFFNRLVSNLKKSRNSFHIFSSIQSHPTQNPIVLGANMTDVRPKFLYYFVTKFLIYILIF